MTGPLAPQFATVRAFVQNNGYEIVLMSDGHNSAVPIKTEPVLAALSVIERHVQEMESLLERVLDYGSGGYQEHLARRSAWVSAQSAALSAREEGDEG